MKPSPSLPLESNREEEILIEESSSRLSRTVRYKGRYLYSKYNPERSVLSLIQATKILSGSIIIICSPCLWYGLDELCKAAEETVEVCAIEADVKLYSLAKESLGKKNDAQKVHFYFKDQLDEFESFLNGTISTGKFRRVIKIDFSAGVQFNAQWYSSVCNAAEQMVASYWKNRITLVKMGRLFSHNIFKNLSLVQGSSSSSESFFHDIFLQDAAASVSKPILVVGAGESLDRTFSEENTSFVKEVKNGRFFVIAVDAASQALLARGIKVDAVVAVESQFAIQESYMDFAKEDFEKTLLFADLCSRTQVARLFKNRIWFASEYAKCRYLDCLKERGIVQDFVPPLGSVGLTAVYIALVIRKNDATSIFVTGMDFSYSAGKTHAKNVSASKALLRICSRKSGNANYAASFLPPAFCIQGKDQEKMYSSPVMESYAVNFAAVFSGQKNLYDMGAGGMDLHLKRCLPSSAPAVALLQNKDSSALNARITLNEACCKERGIGNYLAEEKASLKEMKDLLVKGEKSSFRKEGLSLEGQILNLLSPREYLFLHFPDGNAASSSGSFLKRVRAEIDSFLKILNQGSRIRTSLET